MSTIRLIGLGAMGRRLVGRLVDCRNRGSGTNRTKSNAHARIDRVPHWCDTPRDVGAAADPIFSTITDDKPLAAVTRGPQGSSPGSRTGRCTST